MLRRRYVVLTSIVLCWLLAGMNGGRVDAAAEAPVQGSGSRLSLLAESATSAASPLTAKDAAQKLEASAEALYGYVLNGDVIKSRQESEKISQIFISSSFEGLTSVEGVNALSSVIIDLKAALAAAQISPQRWEAAAAKLRLAVNSLNHPRQPMWLQYYKLIQEDLNDMEQSAAANDLKGWQTALERLQTRYDTIRPAIMISRPPETVNAFDSWLSYAAGIPSSSQPVERARLLEIISYGQDAARVLFGKERNEPALTLPLAPQGYGAWGLLAGGFIIASLVYVAYRKYRGENGVWKRV